MTDEFWGFGASVTLASIFVCGLRYGARICWRWSALYREFKLGLLPLSESIEQQFRAAAKLNPARDAVSDGHTTLTYSEILAATDRGACELLQAKLKDSEPVVVPVSNLATDIAAFLAVWRAGGVVVPVHRAMPKTPFDALTTRLGNRFALDRGVKIFSKLLLVPQNMLYFHYKIFLLKTSWQGGRSKCRQHCY